jgi:hypothetical protein
MRSGVPSHATRIQICGASAWIWETGLDRTVPHGKAHNLGWSVMQGQYHVDLENVERDGHPWHTVDWVNQDSVMDRFQGGLVRSDPGHLDRDQFIVLAAGIISALKSRLTPQSPPKVY